MLDITATTDRDLHCLIGSSAFLPSLLAYVRDSSSGNLPLDPGIFQAILQCMVAGDKYLILLTPEEDVSLVVRLAVWTLSYVFDLPTHRAKIRSRTTSTQRYKDLTPPQNPNLFLRSLFLLSHKSDGGEPSRLSCHARSRSSKRRPSFMRPASAPNDPHHSDKLSAGTSHHNSASDGVSDSVPSTLTIAAPQPRPFIHASTDPLPLLHKEEPEFPRALVLNGLERASVAEQTALAQALTRRQIVFESVQNVASLFDPSSRRTPSRRHNDDHYHKGNNPILEDTEYRGTWNLPDDFILVSVCPSNSRERPKIHRSMLDLFAMSSTIYVQKPVRDAWKALPFAANTLSQSRKHSYSNPPTPAPPQIRTSPALSPALPSTTHRPSRSHLSQQASLVPKQLIPRNFIVSLQKAAQSAYVSSQLSLYMSDLFAAVRHHPKLDGTFLTAKSMNDANDLARAGRVLGTDPIDGELLRYYPTTGYEGEDDEDSARGQLSSEMHEYIASGSESVTLDIPRESISLHSRKVHDANSVSVSHPEDPTGTLFVSEAAIARVVPRAVTHRLRVRDGPSDEVLAGAVFGATFGPNGKESSDTVGYGWDTRSTIKDILVEILAEV